jgi:hypothetical protein
MANRDKGEVSLDLGGTSYTLALGTNQLIALEDLFEPMTLEEIFGSASRGSFKHIRGLMWAATLKYHPGLSVTDVGNLIDQAGGVFGLSKQLKALGLSTIPDDADLTALGVEPKANPRKAQARKRAGTGRGSIATPAASA